MKAWLTTHAHACERAIKRLISQPMVTLLSVFVIGMAITLPLGLYVVFANVSAAASRVKTEPNVNVYLALSTTEQETREVEKKLKALNNVDHVTFMSRDSALAEMKRVSNLADLVASLETNPLPHAFSVRPAVTDAATLESLRASIARLPKVDDITMNFERAQMLRRVGILA